MEREKNAKKVMDRLDKRKKTYIFGAGAVGNGMAEALESCNFIQEDRIAFLVNDGEKRENEKVIELSDCRDNLEECNVIYAIQSDEKCIYEKLVKRKSVNDIIFVDIDTLTSFFALSYEEIFKENNISFTDKFIDCNGIKVINPFLINKSLANTFYGGFGDIILPECMGDYSRAEEGAYINGKVKIEKGDVIIDCGANIGLFTAVAAAKGGRVYAFEPMRELAETIGLLNEVYDNVIVENVALTDRIGKERFYLDYAGFSGSSFGKKLEKAEEVCTITLDEFVIKNGLERVDFIKADIEGSERKMLKGAVEVMKKYAPKLSICTYHLPDDKQVLEQIVREANPKYKIVHKWKKMYAWIE